MALPYLAYIAVFLVVCDEKGLCTFTIVFFFIYVLFPFVNGVDARWHTHQCSTVDHIYQLTVASFWCHPSLCSTIFYWVFLSFVSPVLSFPSASYLRSVPLLSSHANNTSHLISCISFAISPSFVVPLILSFLIMQYCIAGGVWCQSLPGEESRSSRHQPFEPSTEQRQWLHQGLIPRRAWWNGSYLKVKYNIHMRPAIVTMDTNYWLFNLNFFFLNIFIYIFLLCYLYIIIVYYRHL